MIPAMRKQKILNLLQSGEILYTDYLLDTLGISLSTLRRDLKELENDKKISHLHGGGVQIIKDNIELKISAKLNLNKEAKEAIAKKAASFVNSKDVIFLDPSSTTLPMIPYLKGMDITVVTNGLYHINQLCSEGIPCIMLGGSIKTSTNSCIGHMTESSLKELYFNKAFLGANGFSIKAGITNHDGNEKQIKRIAIANAQQSYFLLDSSKYGIITMTKVASLDEVPIITEKDIPELKEYTELILS